MLVSLQRSLDIAIFVDFKNYQETCDNVKNILFSPLIDSSCLSLQKLINSKSGCP